MKEDREGARGIGEVQSVTATLSSAQDTETGRGIQGIDIGTKYRSWNIMHLVGGSKEKKG
jgi:hypothetical protein